jgi:hypothetical protein
VPPPFGPARTLLKPARDIRYKCRRELGCGSVTAAAPGKGQFMTIPIKPLVLAAAALFAAAPLGWGQESGSNSARPRDISGQWVLELGPGCAGPIEVSAPQASDGAHWTAVLTAACGNLSRKGRYTVWAEAGGTYHFSGTVTFGDGSEVNSYFDMYWAQDGKALVGAGGNGRGHVMHK